MTLSITVDVDGEAGLHDGGRGHADRLTSRSERIYGITRGLPRILAALEGAGAPATFYVPGATALRHPEALAAITAEGHEIGHHGHHHLLSPGLSAAEQRAELTDGLAALESTTGRRPRGYRSPGWELTPATLDLLAALGFAYDSSLMGDDRPYAIASGDAAIVELPVHWSLDDAPHFAATTDPAGLLAVWLAECRAAHAERRHVTYTLHPDILGRPHRLDVLRRLLDLAAQLGVRAVTHAEAAASAAA